MISSISAVLLCASATIASASEILLKVRSSIDQTEVSFSREALMDLPQTSFETATIWSEGVNKYSGPLLADVLAAAEMPDGDLHLIAINDYNVSFPMDRVQDDAPIIALEINGKPFSVREKGPLWVMFPFDENAKFRTEDTFALSVWQLAQIDVVPAEK